MNNSNICSSGMLQNQETNSAEQRVREADLLIRRGSVCAGTAAAKSPFAAHTCH